MTRKVKSSLLFEFAEKFANEMNIQISDMWEKRNTRRSDPFGKRTTKIKYQLKLITSPTSNLQVLINTAEIESILNEKIQALKERAQPRDLFDIWYISQIEKMDFKKLLSRKGSLCRKNFELLKVIKKSPLKIHHGVRKLSNKHFANIGEAIPSGSAT